MINKTAAKTSEQVKKALREKGITITQWAEERGYPRQSVYRVLNGVEKAAFGRAHSIAVDLGLKLPLDNREESTMQTAPVEEQTNAEKHFNQYRHALISRHIMNGEPAANIAKNFAISVEEVFEAVRTHDIATAHERYRCNLIHYRLSAGQRKEQVAKDFGTSVEDIDLALIKHTQFEEQNNANAKGH